MTTQGAASRRGLRRTPSISLTVVPADIPLVHSPEPDHSDIPSPGVPSPAEARYGLAAGSLSRAWTVADVQRFLGIGSGQVRATLRREDAPPRLPVVGSYRWNAAQIVAWLHGDDWRNLAAVTVEDAAPGASSPHGSTGPPTVTQRREAPLTVVRQPSATSRLAAPEDLAAPISEERPSTTDVRVVDPAVVHQRRIAQQVGQIVVRRS